MAGKIEIYGRDDCRYCAAAIALCTKFRLPAVYHNMTGNDLLKDELIERLGGKQPETVPQIFIGAHRIGGFEDLKRSLPVVQQILFGG